MKEINNEKLKKNSKRLLLVILTLGLITLTACDVENKGWNSNGILSNENELNLTPEKEAESEKAEEQGQNKEESTENNNESKKHFGLESATKKSEGDNKVSMSISEIYNQRTPSVVALTTKGTVLDFFGYQSEMESAGSGVIISQDGYILTCNHVIAEMQSITVLLNSGEKHEATVIGGDRATDLAVLKIEAKGLTPVTLGNSGELEIGELAVAIGNPLGEFANSLTAGVISGTDRAINIDGSPMNVLQTDTAISPGNSGGGLFNSYGELIGITSAKSAGSGVEGIGFAIPVNDAKAIINDLVNFGYVSRPYMGVSVMTITEETSKAYKMPIGAYIAEVVEGGPADQAGLKVGDIIIKADGKDIKSNEELVSLKNEKKIGDILKLTIMHNNKEAEVNLTLEKEPAATKKKVEKPTNPNVPEGLPPEFEEYFNQMP